MATQFVSFSAVDIIMGMMGLTYVGVCGHRHSLFSVSLLGFQIQFQNSVHSSWQFSLLWNQTNILKHRAHFSLRMDILQHDCHWWVIQGDPQWQEPCLCPAGWVQAAISKVLRAESLGSLTPPLSMGASSEGQPPSEGWGVSWVCWGTGSLVCILSTPDMSTDRVPSL